MTTRRRSKLELSRGTASAIWILVLAGSCARPRASSSEPRAEAARDEPSHVIPFTAPELRSIPGDGTDAARASKLIEALAEIAKPDYGFSPTLRGEAFPPVPGSERDYAWIYTDHGLDRSTAVLGLVELGPRAIPSLLEHIDDGRPTRLEVKAPRWGGSVDHACELPINPAIAAERAALEEAGISMFPDRRSTFLAASVEHHVVTVGDVCFAILGMITNRPYAAVRYQPSGLAVVNSPAREPRLAAAARRMWDVPDHRAALFRRLLVDFHSRGARTWSFEVGASMRLLHYFPVESAPLIVRRLEDSGMPLHPELMQAVAWCQTPEVREALRAIARESDEKAIVIACTPAMAGAADESYLAKLQAMLSISNRGYEYPNNDSCGLLAAIADLFPGRAAAVFREYLETGGSESAINLVELFDHSFLEIAPSVLVPVLDDTSEGMGYYLEVQADSGTRAERPEDVPMRLCDNAYFILSAALGEKDDRPGRSKEDMDARIALLRQRLAGN